MTYCTCIYCGKPTVHPERLYRYCTSDDCVKKGTKQCLPEYDTTTVSSNEAELIATNGELIDELASANDAINSLEQEVNKLKAAIVNLATRERRDIESEARVARWDVIRFIVSQHENLKMGLEIIMDNPGNITLFGDIYREHIDFYNHKLKRLGIEVVGEYGSEVLVDHAKHESDHKQGSAAVIVKHGYYFPEDDYYIQKPIVISIEEWNARNS